MRARGNGDEEGESGRAGVIQGERRRNQGAGKRGKSEEGEVRRMKGEGGVRNEGLDPTMRRERD